MLIWILAIVLLVLFAGIGFAKGAIRMVISLFGLLIAMWLAEPAGRALQPLMGTIGVTNPVWAAVVPPIIAFFLIYLVIMGLSFFVHHKVYLNYKYKHDDVDRIRWERMNRAAGLGLGVVTGSLFFLLVSGLIYAAGYLTVQLSAEDNNPGMVKFINSVREGMAQTGFDKAAAKFEPASDFYYQSADVLGLLYHNPLLQSRLATYPYLLSLGQRPEMMEIANDKEYNDLIFGKAPVTQIIDHPRTQALLGNDEVLAYLKGADLTDLKEYLRTGKSPKYDEQEILGVWNLDKEAVLTHMRKANPDIKSRELRELKQRFEAVPAISLLAMPEKKVAVRIGNGAPAATEEAVEEVPEDPLAARYGANYGRPQQPVAPAAPAQPAPAPLFPQITGEGSWDEQAGQYIVTLTGENGNEMKGTARIRADEMVLTFPQATLVFAKQ